MTLTEILETARLQCTPQSDYQLAKELGVSRGLVSAYRHGLAHPSTKICIKLANLTANDPLAIISMVEYLSAKKEKDKDFWRSFLEMRHIAYRLFF